MNRTAFLFSTAAISLALCASAQTVPQPGNLKPAPQLLKLHQGAGLPDSVAKRPGAVMSDFLPIAQTYSRPQDRDLVLEGLRRAGVPE